MVTIDTTHDDALREVPFARETIYDGHILHVEKWRVTCPNGREAPREIVVHKGAAAKSAFWNVPCQTTPAC